MSALEIEAGIELLEIIEKRTGMTKATISRFSTQKFERVALAERLETLSNFPNSFWKEVDKKFNIF